MNIIETKNSIGPGNIVFVEVVSTGLTEVLSGFGKIGKSAESVASDACEPARSYLASGAAVGELGGSTTAATCVGRRCTFCECFRSLGSSRGSQT
jgi:RNA 3'-terminal phosphate cyclase